MSEAPLHFKTITQLAELLKSKQLSPVELTEKSLERIEELDARFKSYATVLADHAQAAAQNAEKEIMSGAY